METVTPPHLVHDIKPGMLKETQELREKAYSYLITLRGEGMLGASEILHTLAPGEASALQAGEISAAFFINDKANPSVLKLRHRGADAEAEALRVWKQVGADVPDVKGSGVVPGTEGAIKYVHMEAVLDQEGNLAPGAWHYLKTHPEARTQIITTMGLEMAKIHSVQTDKPFGAFADSWGSRHPEPTYQSFLKGLFYNYSHRKEKGGEIRNYFAECGISDEEVEGLNKAIDATKFPEKGTYIHGDMGYHNVLIQDGDRLRVRTIDPNPRIADPYWDLAHQAARSELRADDPAAQEYIEIFMSAYQSMRPEPIDATRLDLHKIAVNLSGFSFFESRALNGPVETADFAQRKSLIKTITKRVLQ
jgi:fructosamine-3-kinase